MKTGSFDERVAKCLAQFHQVETRANERGPRLEIESRAPRDAPARSGIPRKG